MNNFVGKIRKWAALPLLEFQKLLMWLDLNTVDFRNPSLLVASASMDGQTVALLTAEPVYLLSSPVISCETSDVKKAGEAIQKVLDAEARKAGVGRFLMLVPEEAPRQPGEFTLRVYERPISRAVGEVDCYELNSVVKFMN